jgi:hypothetical protein
MAQILTGTRVGGGFRFKSLTNRTTSIVNSSLNFNPASSSFTMAMVVYFATNASAIGSLITNGGNSLQGYYLETVNNGSRISFYFWNSAGVNSISIDGNFLGQVNTIVFSYTPTGSFLMVNGVFVTATYSVFSGSYNANNNFYFGGARQTGANPVVNYTLEAIWYNCQILTGACSQADAVKYWQKDGDYIFTAAGLSYLGNYKLDSKSGTTIYNSKGTLPDLTVFGTANTTPGSGNQWVDENQVPWAA